MFTDRFGGSTVQASDVMYREVALSADEVLQWPAFSTDGVFLARIMDVTAAAPGLSMTLPDATLASMGQDALFNNLGANNFLVLRDDGTTLYTVSPGQSIYFYLSDTSTAAGGWEPIVFGALTATLDLSNAAGNGLVVASGKLAVSPLTSAQAGNIVIAATNRAQLLLWTGGTGTYTLPLTNTLGQFFFEVRNQGTGALTLLCTGGETIDSSASIVLQLGESCFVHAGTGAWFTVGRGRSTQFAFTQLQKTVTGGTVVLSLTEAANVVQTYTGALLSNVDIVVPAVVQVYYVSNQTSGAFNFRVKNPGAGTTVSLPTGQNAVLFSDGTNVINASTTVAGISSLVLAAGSAATPSLGVGALTTGLYSPGANQVGVSANGAQVAIFNPSGLTVTAPSGQVGVITPSGNASLTLDRPVGSFGATSYYTSGVLRWRHGVNSTAEGGANAGSDYVFERYSDAGGLLGTMLTFNRATGAAAFGGPVSATTITGVGLASVTTAGGNPTLLLTDTGANGSNLKLTGDGGTTPSKTIRVKAGIMEWMNNAYTVAIASLTDAGTFTAVNVGISSDKRLKDNIRTNAGARVRLKKLRGCLYERKGTGRTEGGLIAQEVLAIYPWAIGKDSNGNLTVEPMAIIADLVQAWSEEE
jgi:hypothetical protein